jgi:hypothetical protein
MDYSQKQVSTDLNIIYNSVTKEIKITYITATYYCYRKRCDSPSDKGRTHYKKHTDDFFITKITQVTIFIPSVFI